MVAQMPCWGQLPRWGRETRPGELRSQVHPLGVDSRMRLMSVFRLLGRFQKSSRTPRYVVDIVVRVLRFFTPSVRCMHKEQGRYSESK